MVLGFRVWRFGGARLHDSLEKVLVSGIFARSVHYNFMTCYSSDSLVQPIFPFLGLQQQYVNHCDQDTAGRRWCQRQLPSLSIGLQPSLPRIFSMPLGLRYVE